MDPDRWHRIEELLDAALELPTEARAEYLRHETSESAELFEQVWSILQAGEQSGSLLDSPAAHFAAPLLSDEHADPAPPQRVGPYRIEKQIGEGGMGSVYLARRDDGQFDQRVALKVVRHGLHLDARMVRRFRHERQILAALNHPGIARLLDGGLTEHGLPYFAMEYVEGEPIDRYCESRLLGIEARLHLFAHVCDALEHAHTKQIVHRDIKPSNILVTTTGEPRLLDFGIAKLLAPLDDGEHPVAHTRQSERLLTPEYASPEQLRGEPVGIASDVYCLGVLLYELLTGQRPFRRAQRSAHDLERAVLEEDPTRPSEVVRRDPLRRRLKGDLDTIVLTAMQKEAARRYASAAELAADVRRHLAGQPVRARGSSRAYRLRRWTARHRRAVVSATVVAVAGSVGGTVIARASAPRRLVLGSARHVAFDPELALDAELSPDGSRIAFVAGTGTAMRLYVETLGSGRATPVATGLSAFQRWPRWAPDGERIAFMASSRIYEIPADGGSARVLVEPDSGASFVGFPAWSPDGSEIAYVQDSAVFIRAMAGGSARRLARAPLTSHSLRWSPNGEFIAVVSGNREFALGTYPWVSIANLGNAGPSALLVMPVRGGEPSRVTIGGARALNTSPLWMPDSRSLLYISNQDGARDVYRVPLDRHGRRVGEPQRMTTGLGAHTISLSADGRLFAYSIFRLVANIWSATAPADGQSSGEARPVTRGAQSVEGLALSPDGKWLAFDSDRTGSHDIYRVPVDGGEAKQLTTDPRDEFMPQWSRDGREIAFHAFTPQAARQLEIVSSDGGTAVAVTPQPRNQRQPDWSPDGRALVFDAGVSVDGDLYIVERTPTGAWGAARRLTTEGGGSGRWSPDGRELLYVRGDGLWITTPAGGAGRRLLPVDGSSTYRLGTAVWSRDGRAILFKRADAEGRTSFWSVPARGGTPRLVAQLGRELRSDRPDFTTDGRRFFFTVTERVSDIWTMDMRTMR
jgi:Tol biopolymer transport system component/serine/threonine protein kinase